jgi:hypothetical protein
MNMKLLGNIVVSVLAGIAEFILSDIVVAVSELGDKEYFTCLDKVQNIYGYCAYPMYSPPTFTQAFQHFAPLTAFLGFALALASFIWLECKQ